MRKRSPAVTQLSLDPGEALRQGRHQDRHEGTVDKKGVPVNRMINELLVHEAKAGA